jgi:uncharacterized membrane protein
MNFLHRHPGRKRTRWRGTGLDLGSYRVRLMETDFYAAVLVPPFRPSPEWAEGLRVSVSSSV